MSEDDLSSIEKKRLSTRVLIGGVVISFLGILFGTNLLITGSFVTWRSDAVLGLFNLSGWHFNNLIAGDGLISFIFGVISFPSLILGAVFRKNTFYMIALTCFILALALSIYEVAFLYSRSGIVSPGHGIFMVCGGGFIGSLCSLGGYLMMGAQRKDK